ncbi:thioredoxin reductase [Peribacillus deserti]|uniref:Thioredoxin reductase n=1 Tax=Peribacillus deserti TaxID=673318 RepID=A0ABS2QJW7_9BACI|nr:NAD(P)/FAD-dependent oxidoreductase [Peribacillus deserti]MBM7693468.1 thioredoxin reductase [Peribacillus deserti]
MFYETIIIGGGIAGLQAAIQLGRAQRKALVIDSNRGRSTLCRSYHNILGWPDGISGEELRRLGRQQAEQVGIQFTEDTVSSAEKTKTGFTLTTEKGKQYEAKRILIATGIIDRIPDLPEIYECLGNSAYICPDCDGYEIKDELTIIAGSGNAGANMALTLSYWTDKLIYINHEQQKVDKDLLQKLKDKHIEYLEEPIKKVVKERQSFQGFILDEGRLLSANKCFLAFGGNEVKSQLAKQLGVEVMDNNHIKVDPRTQMTNVENVWAAGDVTVHSEQVAIAMGDGLQAAIWIHKSLLNEK